MKTNRRVTIAGTLLLISMLCTAAVSCGNDIDDARQSDTMQNNGTATNAQTEAETLPPYAFFQQELDYGGHQFRVLTTDINAGEIAILQEDITVGEIVGEAIYERNMRVGELMNVEISEATVSSWTELAAHIQQSVMAGDEEFDVICGAIIEVFTAASNGNLIDLNEIKTLDLTADWWDPQIIEAFDFGNGKTYMLNGGINYWDDYGLACLYFNRELMERNDLELPYEAVRNGEWDYEMFYGTYLKGFYRDLNGDSIVDAYDQFGYTSNADLAPRLGCGFDMLAIQKDEDRKPIFRLDEKYYDRFSAIVDVLCNDLSVGIIDKTFPEEFTSSQVPTFGNTLFWQGLSTGISRDSEFSQGVVPMPKYTEEQENYMCSVLDNYCSVIGVPVTNTDLDRTGYVLDAMSYWGKELIYPAVIEKNVLVKSVHDEDSADMFRIIFASKAFDLTYITGWGRWSGQLHDYVFSGKNNLASKEAAYAKRVNKDIENCLEAFGID